MSKFSALAADVSAPFVVELRDMMTDEVIRDANGKAAFISVWSVDSPKARDFDKSRRKDLRQRILQSRTGRIEMDDQVEENMTKCAALTADWYLVDPGTGEPLNEPCTAENAADLYAEPGLGHIFAQVWGGAINIANFMRRGSKNSAPSPNGNSGTTAN